MPDFRNESNNSAAEYGDYVGKESTASISELTKLLLADAYEEMQVELTKASTANCSTAYLQNLWKKYPPPNHQYDSHALRGNPAYEQATKCFLTSRRKNR